MPTIVSVEVPLKRNDSLVKVISYRTSPAFTDLFVRLLNKFCTGTTNINFNIGCKERIYWKWNVKSHVWSQILPNVVSCSLGYQKGSGPGKRSRNFTEGTISTGGRLNSVSIIFKKKYKKSDVNFFTFRVIDGKFGVTGGTKQRYTYLEFHFRSKSDVKNVRNYSWFQCLNRKFIKDDVIKYDSYIDSLFFRYCKLRISSIYKKMCSISVYRPIRLI